MTKPQLEFRVVCAHFETLGHRTHKYPKANGKKATQSVIDLNHSAEMGSSTARRFYANEAPYRVQTREVSAWADDE